MTRLRLAARVVLCLATLAAASCGEDEGAYAELKRISAQSDVDEVSADVTDARGLLASADDLVVEAQAIADDARARAGG